VAGGGLEEPPEPPPQPVNSTTVITPKIGLNVKKRRIVSPFAEVRRSGGVPVKAAASDGLLGVKPGKRSSHRCDSTSRIVAIRASKSAFPVDSGTKISALTILVPEVANRGS
jgi:hypothetical protein